MATNSKLLVATGLLACFFAFFLVRKLNSDGIDFQEKPLGLSDRSQREGLKVKSSAENSANSREQVVVREGEPRWRLDFLALGEEYSGERLIQAQLSFITETCVTLDASELISFLNMVYINSGDAVFNFAVSSISPHLFKDGVEKGLEILEESIESPFSKSLQKGALQYLTSLLSIRDVELLLGNGSPLFSEHQNLSSFISSRAAIVGLSTSDLESLGSLVNDEFLTQSDLGEILGRMGADSEFEGIGNELLNNSNQGLLPQVIGAWAEHYPEEAAHFIETQSFSELVRSKAVGYVIDSWFRSDPKKAASWVLESSTKPYYDSAARALSLNLVPTDPFGAIDWALSISNSKEKTDVLQSVMTIEKSNDELRTYLNSHLPEFVLPSVD
ncbi:hypothetical protein [Roseibacillus persicicus]|uniref:hypothetical protein n=1 Tax=Roseibacillus persicicus TaxID=454148 RepID=UPI00280F9C46|nr:hypothetical protein [Roseibacillus persicicus]MDQ8192601.1 hypothetical protein [Roseibacillus persicicus]